MAESLLKIDVATRYLPEHPTEKPNQFPFAYHIVITNLSDEKVQLISRYWLISDADGKQTEVRGDGVVGKQPVIEPGKSYEYTSGAILDTPVGSMQGYYVMKRECGDTFRALIAPFRLAVTSMLH